MSESSHSSESAPWSDDPRQAAARYIGDKLLRAFVVIRQIAHNPPDPMPCKYSDIDRLDVHILHHADTTSDDFLRLTQLP